MEMGVYFTALVLIWNEWLMIKLIEMERMNYECLIEWNEMIEWLNEMKWYAMAAYVVGVNLLDL